MCTSWRSSNQQTSTTFLQDGTRTRDTLFRSRSTTLSYLKILKGRWFHATYRELHQTDMSSNIYLVLQAVHQTPFNSGEIKSYRKHYHKGKNIWAVAPVLIVLYHKFICLSRLFYPKTTSPNKAYWIMQSATSASTCVQSKPLFSYHLFSYHLYSSKSRFLIASRIPSSSISLLRR